VKESPENAKNESEKKEPGPLEFAKEGSVKVPIYATTNRIYRKDPETGKKELKSEHPQFTVIYYLGQNRIKRKFASLDEARQEAGLAANRLANGETEVLKLTGLDRSTYVNSMQKLHEWRPDADLYLSVTDYVSAAKRLPEKMTLKDLLDDYEKRHPIGLPDKTIQVIVNELVESKRKAGRSDRYIEDLEGRLNQFAENFQVRLPSVTGAQIETYIRSLGAYSTEPGDKKFRPLSGRSQNNHRRIIGTLIKFAIKRGYLPKDYSELEAVEKAADDSGEIEIFFPDELRKLLAACSTPVKERKVIRTREEVIPYLAIGAFAGLRSAEIERLDWAEVNIPQRFIEIKAAKAKTASRRLAPITENLAAWLAPYVKESGPVAPYANMSKQLTEYLAPQAGVEWKHNALRHSFISYRLADIKDMAQVSLEAGNSAQMIFKHYRQLVTEAEAKEWFSIVPVKKDGRGEIVPMPKTDSGHNAPAQDATATSSAVKTA
jgi:integrase